jgi:glyoxylase-like metal-dependent hydrolase (beta-lactamase superfamily II)
MKMHLLSGGRLRMRKSIFLPDADRSESIELPVSCALLRHRQGNVLFDTGCHPSVADDAEARWGGLAKLMVPIMPPDENVVSGLAGLGLACHDIDVVVCSHLHPDHCGCNTYFKRATVILHRKEIEAARAPGAENVGYIGAEWEQDVPTDAIDGERDLFGDGRIVLLPMPGHT